MAATRAPAVGAQVVALCLVWLVGFALTPGLLEHGAGALVTRDPAGAILVETVLAALLLAVVLVVARARAQHVLRRSRWLLAYALPAVLLLLLPLHYRQDLPLALYAVWITVSVLWQDVLTFGLLQTAIRQRLAAVPTVAVVACAFATAHAVLLSDRFAPPALLPLLGILVLGAAFASIRAWSGGLHLLIALHLSFYFAFS